MRLDARKGDTGWFVYDAEACRKIEYAVWFDDETAQYGVYDGLFFALVGEPTTIQAKRIVIYPDRKLVIVNPVEDDEDAGESESTNKREEITA